MRILIRTSRWALWARRLGSLALPLLVIPVGLHHLRLIGGDVFLAAITLGGIVAFEGLVISLIALGHLWQSGDRGWDKALSGLFLSVLCLLPYGYYGMLALEYPAVTDIATADRGTMPLVFEPGTAAMPPPKTLSVADIDRIFPNVKTRDYPLRLPEVFALVQQAVTANGWQVRILREPGAAGEAGQINAQITTLPGWREEVVIHLTGTATSAEVDMRSVSLNAPHDFGSNGRRIERFLLDLDDAVTAWLRDNPAETQPAETEAIETPPVEEPAAP